MIADRLGIQVALPCEARPLVSALGMQRDRRVSAFPVYRSDKASLIVSGIGALNAATAVANLAGYDTGIGAWINYGIAGHLKRAIGTVLLVDGVSLERSRTVFSAQFLFQSDLETESLLCVETPDPGYTFEGLVDMEAGGFFFAARKFVTPELVHSLKVVSDNKASGYGKIDRISCEALINGGLDAIVSVTDALLSLVAPAALSGEAEKSMRRMESLHNFSTGRQNLLRRQFQLCLAAGRDEKVIEEAMRQTDSARQCLRRLFEMGSG